MVIIGGMAACPTSAMTCIKVTGWKLNRRHVVSCPGEDSLSAALSNFRRLVASLMLVAMASLVIHGGGMAGGHQHGLASSECARHEPAAPYDPLSHPI